MDSLIAESVSRNYTGNAVVSEASLAIMPGKVTALLGGSGAGKSTLLRLFAGLEPVDGGQIKIGDIVLSSRGKTIPAEKRNIGLVFQDFALFPHMTASQNVQFGLRNISKAHRRASSKEWLSKLGLAHRMDAYPQQLSGGEQQRVAIARALAPEPSAILLDEPFSGLDPALRQGVRKAAFEAIHETGIPALLVTHDADEAMAVSDHLAVMRKGKIVQQDVPELVYSRPESIETAAALGQINQIPAGSPLAAFLGAASAVRVEGVRIDPEGPVRAQIVSIRRVGSYVSISLNVPGHGILYASARTCDLQPGECYEHQLRSRA